MKNYTNYLLVFILSLLTVNCSDKFDITEARRLAQANEKQKIGDTIYVLQKPVWDQFVKPKKIIVGKDGFLYVADSLNGGRIVLLNLAGQKLSETFIKNPYYLAQDYKLNLFVCAEFDTLSQTFSAVYKINLFDAKHNLAAAKAKRILPKTSLDFSKPERRFTSVAVFYNNDYIISRRGPINGLVDPDNSILYYNSDDEFFGRLTDFIPEGTGILTADDVSSMIPTNRRNKDFMMTIIGATNFKFQWFKYVSTMEKEGYEIFLKPGIVDVMKPNRFIRPLDLTIDSKNNIYIVDAVKDSVLKFNQSGDEYHSFGGPEFFEEPVSVAHFDRTLFVADKKKNAIMRFILSTEIR